MRCYQASYKLSSFEQSRTSMAESCPLFPKTNCSVRVSDGGLARALLVESYMVSPENWDEDSLTVTL